MPFLGVLVLGLPNLLDRVWGRFARRFCNARDPGMALRRNSDWLDDEKGLGCYNAGSELTEED